MICNTPAFGARSCTSTVDERMQALRTEGDKGQLNGENMKRYK